MHDTSNDPADDGAPVPVVPEGPGWYGHGPNFDDDCLAAFATVYLEERTSEDGATRGELYITAAVHGSDERRECGAELTIDDLAALVIRACVIGAAAATADERHFFAEAFDRAREHMDRVTEDPRA